MIKIYKAQCNNIIVAPLAQQIYWTNNITLKSAKMLNKKLLESRVNELAQLLSTEEDEE